MLVIVIIKTKRKRLDMSQEDLAKKLGISQPAVAQWESGVSRPNISLLPKLAEVLECTVDELLKEG